MTAVTDCCEEDMGSRVFPFLARVRLTAGRDPCHGDAEMIALI